MQLMNKNLDSKALLGMKQEYMSMLLQVTRSQWSMYVLGKRDLPIAAKLKLVEMLGFLQQKDNETYKNSEHEKMQDLIITQFLESQQLLNTKLQIDCKQKLKAIEKKYKTAVTALQFINFLESSAQKPTTAYKLLLETIKLDAETEIEKNSLAVQTKLQYKYEMLQMEEKILKKNPKGNDNVLTDDLV